MTHIPKREEALKSGFVTRFYQLFTHREYELLQHQDIRKSGHPDISIHGFQRSTFWEFKHATPHFESPAIQEMMCRRLAARNHCAYVIFNEGPREIWIVHPQELAGKRGRLDSVTPLAVIPAFDFSTLCVYIDSVHRPNW